MYTGESYGGRHWDRTSDLCRVKTERGPWYDRRIGGKTKVDQRNSPIVASPSLWSFSVV